MKTVVITGGPCAGKTSAMASLRDRLVLRGVSAVFVPEAATDLIMAGVAPWTCESMLDFQTQVMALQLEREAEALANAAGTNALVLLDRGICDSHAYLSDDDYARALAANNLDEADVFARYDAVFHLESVAKADPAAYTRSNNLARFENAEEAARADDRVIASWSAHPHVTVIPYTIDFDCKVSRLEELLLAL